MEGSRKVDWEGKVAYKMCTIKPVWYLELSHEGCYEVGREAAES